MKKLALLLFLICTVSSTSAQEWLTDFEIAKTKATQENKSVLLVFQGSDWCAPCMKLEKNIWSSKEFIDTYDQHFVLLVADFPRKKKNTLSKEQTKKNQLLAETYNTKGHFPLVVVLDKKGNVLGHAGYEKISPDAYLKNLISFTN